MLSYFRYIELNLIKKKSVWVGAGVFWLYIGLLLLIVPAILHMGPLFIWSNTLFDLQSYLIIIFAIICGITAVVIFNDPKDDGSELIIISKPNNRWKMVIVKFICFLTHNLIILAIGMIMMLFTLCFGRLSLNNPNGIDFGKLPGMEWSTLLGSLIIILIFGSIAILISILSGKIGILVGTIGFAITINVLYLVAPAISKSQVRYLSDTYDVNLESNRFLTLNNKLVNGVVASSVSDNGTLYYTNDAAHHSTNSIVSYANIAAQMTSIYKINEDNAREVQMNSSYGSNVNYKYNILNETPLIKRTFDSDRPLLILDTNQWTESVQRVDYIFPCIDLSQLSILSMAGANINSMFYIYHNTGLLNQMNSVRFMDVTDLLKYDDEEYVTNFFDNTIKTKYGSEVAWHETETYELFHKQIGDWLIADDYALANALGCPIDMATGDPFTNSYNMTMDAFKIYLLLLKEWSQTMYSYFYEDQKDEINNQTALQGWYGYNEGATQWAIKSRWYRYMKNHNNTNFAYTPYNAANEYYWMTETGEANSRTNPWIIMLQDFSLTSMNHTPDGNGNIVNEIFEYKATPFYTERGVMVFWTSFSLFLFAISVLIYAKTDIK